MEKFDKEYEKLLRYSYLAVPAGMLLAFLSGIMRYSSAGWNLLDIAMLIIGFVLCWAGVYGVILKHKGILSLFLLHPAIPFIIACFLSYTSFSTHSFLMFILTVAFLTGVVLSLIFIQKKGWVVLKFCTPFIMFGLMIDSLIHAQWSDAIFLFIVYFVGRKIKQANIKSKKEQELRKEQERLDKIEADKRYAERQKIWQQQEQAEQLRRQQQEEAQLLQAEKQRLERIKEIGEAGERRVQFGLKMLQDFKGYKVYNGFYLVADNGFYQEIDHFVVGENGVFHIETKTYKGEFEIKPDGSWYKIYNGISKPADTPTSQIERHEMLIMDILKNVLPNDVKLHHILAIGTENVQDMVIWGRENSKYPIVHYKDISSHIANAETERKLTKDEILAIQKVIRSHLRNERPA
ncbi:NERD domain-containing protein (plasmid) [Aneurinibacillus sp. Ricciae_BoGa-3]|uniref:NERD domain-containing protein n=1 Tax=Aneurinibacillus sp. Ricciae_BoGa-3 TaxID=3022697 RepID=UPI00233FE425|nr:NERD domain-containing protein [Aneurinibacillus sp. Ricciae_BoGa-3]WCK56997.1 NERD domain-containing protein [Aneurinibacillus sp. Ricciae_BoGa-3]